MNKEEFFKSQLYTDIAEIMLKVYKTSRKVLKYHKTSKERIQCMRILRRYTSKLGLYQYMLFDLFNDFYSLNINNNCLELISFKTQDVLIIVPLGNGV